MLIDATDLEGIKKANGVTTGHSKVDKGLLRKNELVLIATGVSEFINFVEKEYTTCPRGYDSSRQSGGTDFHEFRTYEDALKVFKTQGNSLVKFDPTEITPRDYHEAGTDVDYDVTGDFIDMGRYMEGIPESMGSMHNGKARERRVRILVDNGHWAGTKSKGIIHRSERIIRLVDALESNGVRTEVVALESGNQAHTEITIKRFDEALSLESVAIATHPEFLRRLGFRVIEQSPLVSGGYGSPTWVAQRMEHLKSQINDEITIYIGNSITSYVDRRFNDLEAFVQEELGQVQPVHNLFMLTVEQVQRFEFGY